MSRIALFVPSMRGGGGERVMLNLVCGFAERGLDVDLVLLQAEGPFLADVPKNVRIIDLKARRLITSIPALILYFRREKPVAFLSAFVASNIVSVFIRTFFGIRTRLVLAEHSTRSAAAENLKSFHERVYPFLMRRSYPHADSVVAVSSGVADDLSKLTGMERDRINVIYNPVVAEQIFEQASEPVDHPWFRAGEPPVILGVGRLVRAKDFPTLIHAFDLVRRERSARLMILGEGEKRAKLESLIKELGLADSVALPGFDPNPYRYMKHAAVFALSSRWEGLGNVLIEAMAVGTPVVSTDCPNGPSEILEGGRHGLLVPVGDSLSLARGILRQLESPMRETLQERANTFTTEAAVQRYADLLGVTLGPASEDVVLT